MKSVCLIPCMTILGELQSGFTSACEKGAKLLENERSYRFDLVKFQI